MKQYLQQVQTVLDEGRYKGDRTGVGCYSVFGMQTRYDLRKGFPLVTTKKVNMAAIVNELLWFIAGKTNIYDPLLGGSKIWNEWALGVVTADQAIAAYAKTMSVSIETATNRYRSACGNGNGVLDMQAGVDYLMGAIAHKRGKPAPTVGDIGPMYGHLWRNFGGVDQLARLMEDLVKLADSRRHVVSAWDPALLPDETKDHATNVLDGQGVLAPCHAFFQVYTTELSREERVMEHNRLNPGQPLELANYVDETGDEKFPNSSLRLDGILDTRGVGTRYIDLQLYQRSMDVALGAPFNIASYSLLLEMMAFQLGYVARYFIHTAGDAHIYSNHVEGLQEQLTRQPKKLPTLVFKPTARKKTIFEMTKDDFELVGYDPHDPIKFQIAV